MDTVPSRISLQEAGRLLRYKSIKSTSRWCRANDVPILNNAGKGKFVLAAEFRLKYLSTIIAHLRNRYGDQWRAALEVHLKDDVLGLMTLIENSKKKRVSQERIPENGGAIKGKNELRFAEKLEQLAVSTT